MTNQFCCPRFNETYDGKQLKMKIFTDILKIDENGKQSHSASQDALFADILNTLIRGRLREPVLQKEDAT